jgi:hypothetical protein
MDIFAQAARHNNQGVIALLDGNDEAAVAALSQSLKMMKQELSKPSNAYGEKSATLSDNCEHSTVELPGLQQGSQESYIFAEAITIPEHGDHSEVDTHIYSAVVVFNLALAVHNEGNKNGKIASMAKAQKLYVMILKILKNNECMNNRVGVLVKLAAINNLSQIRFDCGEYELAREGLHHLSAFIRAGGNTNDALSDEGPEIQGLVMNILLLKAPLLAPAA